MSKINKFVDFLFGPKAIDGNDLLAFWDTAMHYHAWLTNGNEHHVWPKVKKATKEDNKRWDLFLEDGNTITFTTESLGYFNSKNLEMYFNKEIVGSIDIDLSDISAEYFLRKIEFVKEGGWQTLVREFLEWDKARSEKIMSEMDERSVQVKTEKMNKTLE